MIKLLLTSSGITNQSIHNALTDLLGKPISECKAVFIPTGVYPYAGGAFYAGHAIYGSGAPRLAQLGWKALGILELTALPGIEKEVWAASVKEADAVLVWGGNPLYIAYWLKESGLTALLSTLGRDIVYVGVSAGAMTVATLIGEAFSNPPAGNKNVLSAENISFGDLPIHFVTGPGAGLVDFSIIPHFESEDHPEASLLNAAIWAAKLPVPVYAIDDQTAIKVVDGKIEVISEGNWQLFNDNSSV